MMLKEILNKKIIIIILSIVIIVIFGINYVFYEPTEINAFVASKIYKDGVANSAFDDENFYKCVVEAYNNANKTSVAYTENLTDEQLQTITYLSCSGSGKLEDEKIINTNGLEKLTKLKILYITSNKLTEIDISNNVALTELYVINNQLTEIDISKNKALTELLVYNNQLEEIDVSKNVMLTKLNVSYNKLIEIDVSKNVMLTKLDVSYNKLIEIDVSNNEALTELNVANNQLEEIDVSKNDVLTELNVNNNQLEEIDVSKNETLTELYVINNQLTEIDISKNKALTELLVYNNRLIEIDVSNNVALIELKASSNKLTEIDLSKNVMLTLLWLNNNQLEEIDVSKNKALTELNVNNNQLEEIDVSKNVVLTVLRADNNKIKEIDVSNNVALKYFNIISNQLTEIDVSKNVALIDLKVSYNELTEIDVSKNEMLTYLYVIGNNFIKNLYVYNGNNVEMDNPVKLPEHLKWENMKWSSNNSSIASVDQNGLLTTLKSGSVNINGAVSSKYEVINKVNVVEISSNKYHINNEKEYIYIVSDNDIYTIKDNINVSHKDVTLDVDLDSNKLQVKYNQELLKEFKIIKLNSTDYDLSKDYIYTVTNEFDITKINIVNGTKEIKENKLYIKYEDTLLQTYNLVNLSSEEYDLSKDYIYTKTSELDESKINITNGIKTLENNKLLFKYNDDILKEIGVVNLRLNGLELLDDNIYISNMGIDKIENKINVIGGTFVIKDENVKIAFNEEIIHEIKLLSVDLGELEEFNKMMVISDDMTYESYTSNINLSEELSYKIMNGTNEIVQGDIEEGYLLNIYYGNIKVDSFTMTEEYIYLDKTLEVDMDSGYLSNIDIGTKVSDIMDMIDTSGSITITNNKNEVITDDKMIGTGTKISIKLNTKTTEYIVVIPGDVDGDGMLKLGDIMKIASYIYQSNESLSGVYVLAADYNKDSKHNLQDIMQLAKKIYG